MAIRANNANSFRLSSATEEIDGRIDTLHHQLRRYRDDRQELTRQIESIDVDIADTERLIAEYEQVAERIKRPRVNVTVGAPDAAEVARAVKKQLHHRP